MNNWAGRKSHVFKRALGITLGMCPTSEKDPGSISTGVFLCSQKAKDQIQVVGSNSGCSVPRLPPSLPSPEISCPPPVPQARLWRGAGWRCCAVSLPVSCWSSWLSCPKRLASCYARIGSRKPLWLCNSCGAHWWITSGNAGRSKPTPANRSPKGITSHTHTRDAVTIINQEMSLAEFKNPAIYKPFLIGVAMMFFQQASGINALMFYAETIFEDANFKNSSAATVIVGSIQVFFTAMAALVIDKTGRKILLIVSGVIMTASATVFGIYFRITGPSPSNSSHLQLPKSPLDTPLVEEGHPLAWLAVLSMGFFIMGFALGWGPIPWLVMSEIFPLRARGIASGACVLTNWLMAFLVTKEFHDLTVLLTPYGTFWLFSSTCLLNVVFTLFCVPETKGKSLEEIEAHFRRPR